MTELADSNRSNTPDGLARARPSAAGVDAAGVMAFLDDVEAAGLELHDLMLWRDGAVVAEGWRWPYAANRPRMTHSLTKSITACAIGMLIDAGQLTLSDRVAGFFPEYPVDPGTRLARMTVEHLLTMRTGHGHEVSGSVWRGIETSWVEEFFRIPIEHEPGSTHVYSSAASYVLSAIVTRLTGDTIRDYLEPRLFAPLGIPDAHWDIGPDGINPGGNGVSFTTADALKLGILHAQKGVWEGKRVLSEWWVDQATRPEGAPDYGYHWVIGDGYYVALGMFVQMAMVFPASNAVLALNGAMEESSVLLPHLKRHFPALFGKTASAAEDEALARRLAGWSAPPEFASLATGNDASFAGEWRVAENPLGITAVGFEFEPGALRFTLADDAGSHAIHIARDGWAGTTSDLPGASLHHGYRMHDAPTIAGARWIADDTLEIVLHFVESAFRDTILCRVEDGRLTIGRSVNINSAERAWPRLTAVRQTA